MNIFNSLLAQLVKYDVHTTRKINSIHAIFYHVLSLYLLFLITYGKSFSSDCNAQICRGHFHSLNLCCESDMLH